MESEARAGPFCLSEQSAAYRCYLLTQLAHVRFGYRTWLISACTGAVELQPGLETASADVAEPRAQSGEYGSPSLKVNY